MISKSKLFVVWSEEKYVKCLQNCMWKKHYCTTAAKIMSLIFKIHFCFSKFEHFRTYAVGVTSNRFLDSSYRLQNVQILQLESKCVAFQYIIQTYNALLGLND